MRRGRVADGAERAAERKRKSDRRVRRGARRGRVTEGVERGAERKEE